MHVFVLGSMYTYNKSSPARWKMFKNTIGSTLTGRAQIVFVFILRLYELTKKLDVSIMFRAREHCMPGPGRLHLALDRAEGLVAGLRRHVAHEVAHVVVQRPPDAWAGVYNVMYACG